MATPNVAELVTHLHINVDSIHKCIESLSTNSHEAEVERLEKVREANIAALRERHEHDAAELESQRQKEAEVVAEQRRLEEEALLAHRKREEEEIAARRAKEDQERKARVQREEAVRARTKQEEDEARQKEKAEWENMLQEQVEQELERLEDEMEKRVEKGRRALAELRNSINAQIDAALHGGVVPAIKFRSRAKTGQSSRPISFLDGVGKSTRGAQAARNLPAVSEATPGPEKSSAEESRGSEVAEREVSVEDTASEQSLWGASTRPSTADVRHGVEEDQEDVRVREEIAMLNAEFAKAAMDDAPWEQELKDANSSHKPHAKSEFDGAWWKAPRKLVVLPGGRKFRVYAAPAPNLSAVVPAPTEFTKAWWETPRVNWTAPAPEKVYSLPEPNLSEVQDPAALSEFNQTWWQTPRANWMTPKLEKVFAVPASNLSGIQDPPAPSEFNQLWWEAPRVNRTAPKAQTAYSVPEPNLSDVREAPSEFNQAWWAAPRINWSAPKAERGFSIPEPNLSDVQVPAAPSEFNEVWWQTPRINSTASTHSRSVTSMPEPNQSDIQNPHAPTEFDSAWWTAPRVNYQAPVTRSLASVPAPNLSEVQNPPAPTDFNSLWWSTPRSVSVPITTEPVAWWVAAKEKVIAPVVGAVAAAAVVALESTPLARSSQHAPNLSDVQNLPAPTEFSSAWWHAPRVLQEREAGTEFDTTWWRAPRVSHREVNTEFDKTWWTMPRTLQEQPARAVYTEFDSNWWHAPRVSHREANTEFDKTWWTMPRTLQEQPARAVYTEFDSNWWHAPRASHREAYTEFGKAWWLAPRDLVETSTPAKTSSRAPKSNSPVAYTEFDQKWWQTPRARQALVGYTEFHHLWWHTPRERHPWELLQILDASRSIEEAASLPLSEEITSFEAQPTHSQLERIIDDRPPFSKLESNTAHYADTHMKLQRDTHTLPGICEDPEDVKAREEIAQLNAELMKAAMEAEQEEPLSPVTAMNAENLFGDSDEEVAHEHFGHPASNLGGDESLRPERPHILGSYMSHSTGYETANESVQHTSSTIASPDFHEAQDHTGQQPPQRNSGMFASLVNAIRYNVPLVDQLVGGQEYNSVGDHDPYSDETYSQPVQSRNSLHQIDEHSEMASPNRHLDSDEEFPSRQIDKGLRLRTDTTATVPSFDNGVHSDEDDSPTTPSDASSPFLEHSRDEPAIRGSWSPPRQLEAREVQQELKPQASPMREEFDPYNAQTYSYGTPKSSMVNRRPHEPASPALPDENLTGLKIKHPTAPQTLSSLDTSSHPSTSRRAYDSPISPSPSLHSHPASPPQTRISRRPTLTDRNSLGRTQSNTPATTINPNSSSLFQKRRSLFEFTTNPAPRPQTVRPRSGVFHVSHSREPSSTAESESASLL